MPVEHVDPWSEFGLAGLVIAALFAYIWFMMKSHQAERSEWMSAYKDQSRMADSRQAETNEVVRELTAVIRELNAGRRA